MLKNAHFNEDRTHRYALGRIWDNNFSKVMFIGLNPSTADEKVDDNTITRCIGFAKAWGFGGLYMLNLFSLVATDPKDMLSYYNHVSEKEYKNLLADNLRYLKRYGEYSDMVIFAWGANFPDLDSAERVKKLFRNAMCLGKTKDGHPRHPLYLKSDLKPAKF